MKTDYHNLNFFDCAVVVAIGVGAVLLGSIVYLALPEPAQDNLAMSTSVLDLSEAYQAQIGSILAAVELSSDVLDEYYIAFTQVAAIREDLITAPVAFAASVISGFSDYSEHITVAYAENNLNHPLLEQSSGKVLGASTISFESVFGEPEKTCGMEAEHVEQNKNLDIPYSYTAPDISIINKIKIN